MVRVLVACVAGASSTFLARRLGDLAHSRGYDWSIGATPTESIEGTGVDLVALSSHVANDALLVSLRDRGISCIVFPDSVRGGFGTDDALHALEEYFHQTGTHTGSTLEPTELEDVI